MYFSDEDKLLTDREIDVLICLHAGLSNPEIAEKLCITVYTVKAHLSKIFRKLGVSSRVDLLLMLVGEKEIQNQEQKKQVMMLKNNAFSKIK